MDSKKQGAKGKYTSCTQPTVVQSTQKVFVNCEKKKHENRKVTFANPLHSYLSTEHNENIENLNMEHKNSVFGKMKIQNIDKWFNKEIQNTRIAHKSQNHVICSD